MPDTDKGVTEEEGMPRISATATDEVAARRLEAMNRALWARSRRWDLLEVLEIQESGVVFEWESLVTTNEMVPCVGEFWFGEPTSTGSPSDSAVVDQTSFFSFFGFLSVSAVSPLPRGLFFLWVFFSLSDLISSSLPSVSDPTVVTSMTGSSTQAEWKPSVGAESAPSPVGPSEFALSLLSRFSKS